MRNPDEARRLFLEAILKTNGFKYSVDFLEKIIKLMGIFSKNLKKESKNKKRLYLVYDTIITNIFDVIEDYKKKERLMEFAIDEMEGKTKLQIYLREMLDGMERSLELTEDKGQVTLKHHLIDTFSFKIHEFTGEEAIKNSLKIEHP